MTELIKDIAFRAGFSKEDYSNTQVGTPHTKAMNNFIELIVMECNSRVVKYISDCGEISSLPDSVLLEPFGF